MSMLEDLYRHDDPEDGDLEQIIEGNQNIDLDNVSDGDNDHSEAEEAAPKRVDPNSDKKAKVVKNPRITLNPKRLTGPRGIKVIEETFEGFAFKGEGHEKEDLDMVMKKLEHWAHRLYPKFQFDDCLNKIETLGKKKEVTSYARRIRMNMLDEEPIVQLTENDEEDVPQEPVIDEFDRLLEQQIALAKSTPAPTPNNKSTPIRPTSETVDLMDVNTSRAEMTSEQRDRMMKNRLLAEERRLARLKAEHEKKQQNTDLEIVSIDNDIEMI